MLDGTELEILKLARGPLYRRRRDAALAEQVDMARVVEGSRNQPDKRVQIVATILSSWKEHGPRYEGFLSSFGKVNVAQEAAKMTGLGGVSKALAIELETDFGETILPLCWEQLLKFSEELPAWHLHTFFLAIGRLPTEESIEPLLWLVEQTSDAAIVDGAHQALLKLPYGGMKDRFLAEKEVLGFRTFVVDDLLARINADKVNAVD